MIGSGRNSVARFVAQPEAEELLESSRGLRPIDRWVTRLGHERIRAIGDDLPQLVQVAGPGCSDRPAAR